MLDKYKCETRQDYENALKEIIQEIALLGLWRAKFFEHAAFYGGSALRILYGLDRFSEDIDFSLLEPRRDFELHPYLGAIKAELNAMGFVVDVEESVKNIETSIESAFIKAETKEHLIRFDVPEEISARIHHKERMKIRLEVDTDPPAGFETEARILLQPIAFSVRTYKQPDLFAGKIHAVLARAWLSGRIKGRDYYDFVWYIGRDVPVHLGHLEQRLRQTGSWPSEQSLTREDLLSLLDEKFSNLDIDVAKKDILPFIKDPQAVAVWSREFFISLLPRLKVC
jgi:predicted nucleotidyltransferase component of viral defense system